MVYFKGLSHTLYKKGCGSPYAPSFRIDFIFYCDWHAFNASY